jgi:isopentenyl-diphosphate Delta-isomerase
MEEKIILVDENDNEVGQEEKIKAHKENMLHRAFSVFLINSKNEHLLQKRAENKYHSGGLWTNACCSHPRPGETTEAAAHRRLKEEIGIDCPIKEIFSFKYNVKFEENQITENEYDHVFIGKTDDEPILNLDEASAFKWINSEELFADIGKHPENYSHWFKIAIEKVQAKLQPKNPQPK